MGGIRRHVCDPLIPNQPDSCARIVKKVPEVTGSRGCVDRRIGGSRSCSPGLTGRESPVRVPVSNRCPCRPPDPSRTRRIAQLNSCPNGACCPPPLLDLAGRVPFDGLLRSAPHPPP